MGAICQESKVDPLEIISSIDEGLNKNLATHPQHAPEKGYATRAYGVPPLSEEVAAVLAEEMKEEDLRQQNLKGIQLPAFLIHNKQLFYQGEWKDRLPHGKGKIFFPQGHYYEGNFNCGEAESQNAILIFSDGSYYRGELQASQFSGKGKFVTKSVIYEGDWENSKPHGLGKQQFSDGNQYEGEFVDGLKEGRGVFRWKDGKVYEGQFAAGKMNGKGKFYRGEECFQGRFEDNQKIGVGAVKTAYGIYQGPFKEGEFSGEGTFEWKDKKVYAGGFRGGNLDGQGQITFANGKTFRGIWQQGQNIELSEVKSQSPKSKKK